MQMYQELKSEIKRLRNGKNGTCGDRNHRGCNDGTGEMGNSVKNSTSANICIIRILRMILNY